MKKIFAIIIAVLFLGTNSALAFSEVYYLKNTTVGAIKPAVTNALANQDYRIIKQDPYYAQSTKNNADYAVIILQQSGNNMFYYYNSNNNKKINKDILKAVKKAGIIYEQSYNSNIIEVYDNLAQKTITSNTVNNYVFTENEPNYYSASNTTGSKTQTYSSNAYKGYVAKIESGTKLKFYLQNAINTATAVEGDRIIGVIQEDLKYNGISVIPQGSLVYGILSKARHATHGSRNGRVVIDFNQIVTPDGKTYNISAEKIDFTVTNEGKAASVAKDVLVGALVGGLAGLLIGACTKHVGAATAISAGVGAGASALSNVAEMGVDAEIPSFTEMELTLTKSFTASVGY